ncbi:MAG: MoxR family ATPase, partial [Candidatus Eremiobacteraeota bacterium]|nr:MoxR family ATPase [Candidatus Eremiobacteraeota bacterium]
FDARALEESGLETVAGIAEVLAAQSAIRQTHLSNAVRRYIYEIVAATRRHRRLALGASPRSALALLTCTQVAAAIDGRDFATPDDVKQTAPYVLPHRLIVVPEAEIEGLRSNDVLRDILESVEIPHESQAVTA